MRRHLAVIGAVLRKDLQALWPLAALTAALLLVKTLYPDIDRLRLFLEAVYLLAALLIVAVFHQDPVTDVRRDWLTRPIPRGDLLAAKIAFVALVVFVPVVLAKLGANLANGYSPGEAILAATMTDPLLVLVALPALVAIAVTTATPLQAISAAIGTFAGILLVVGVGVASGAYAFGPEVAAFGTGWVGLVTVAVATVGAALAVLVLEYGYRRTWAARAVFLAVVGVLLGAPMLFSWDDVFALQKAMASGAPPRSFSLSLMPGCLPAATTDAAGDDRSSVAAVGAKAPPISPEIWADRVAAAGPNAVWFATPFAVQGLPAHWGAMVLALDLVYLNGDGEVLERLRPAQFTPVWQARGGDGREGSHYWLLPRDAYRRLARAADVTLRLDYSLALLAPRAAEIPVDGRRHEVPGIGYCSAALGGPRQRVLVDCFEHGARPALLAAELTGRPGTRKAAGTPQYMPRWLQALSATRHTLTLPDSAAARRVTLVAYGARAHFIRSVTARGIFGGGPRACPAPKP